jgi:endonuclease/exonuclease/phosphatase (EEP) superfamily protein YafD
MGEPDEQRVRFGRTAILLLAWFAFLVAVVGVTVRYAPVVNHLELIIASLSPFLLLAALVAFGLLWRIGDKRWATLALIPLAVGIGVKVPDYLRDSHQGGKTVPIRVLTINLRSGSAEPAAVAAAARTHTDVLLVQELTKAQADGILAEPGFAADFPYRVLAPHPGAAGVGILSRYPIVQNSRIPRYELGAVTATIRPPGGVPDVLVATIHLGGPWPQPIDRWREEIAALPRTLDQLVLAAGPGATIVAGDFNATEDFLPFRRLLATGFADAVEQAGGGLGLTYPAGSWIPPLIGIDHILTSNAWAGDSGVVPIPGSDHLGVRATIHVPA